MHQTLVWNKFGQVWKGKVKIYTNLASQRQVLTSLDNLYSLKDELKQDSKKMRKISDPRASFAIQRGSELKFAINSSFENSDNPYP